MSEPAPPRDAASILLLRDAPAGLEVLVVRRHESSRDFAGASVFPGGNVDPADEDDTSPWIARPFDAEVARRRLGEALDDARLRALHVAACRELHEEAGVRIATDRLRPFARWITPVHQPRRWDTRFFLAAAPADQIAAADGGETREAIWLRPEAAIAAYRAGEHVLAPPTFRLLEELAPFSSAIAALEAATPPRPVLPHLLRKTPELTLVYPGDRDYPGERAGGGLNRIVSRDGRWFSIRE